VLFAVTCLSILALATGPILVAAGRGQNAGPLVDGFALGVVLALVVVAIVPHLYSELGVPALALLAAGYALLGLAESTGERLAGGMTSLVVPALTIHSLLDGAALALAFRSGARSTVGPPLVIALIVHRFAEGLAAGAALLPRFGRRYTGLCIAAMGVATIVGASFGNDIVARLGERTLHAVVAFGMGVILHLIGHGRARVMRNAGAAIAFAVGLVLAAVLPVAFGG
jgi:hypothetical protein